jgi:hypothetical protein
MTDTTSQLPQKTESRLEHVFPTLTAAQIARIAAHGRRRPINQGEVLVEAGAKVGRSSWSSQVRSRLSGWPAP